MARARKEDDEMYNEGGATLQDWEERFEGQALEYLRELERTGGDLVYLPDP